MTGNERALPSLICLAGESGSGKDTLAAMFTARLGYTRVAIADPLERWVRGIFGLDSLRLRRVFRKSVNRAFK